ncbi:MAG: hypothetical protein N2512_13950 [Armatimonadetes bacterium]|nr:hypothetical protein [Armatimonadota bacterium]
MRFTTAVCCIVLATASSLAVAQRGAEEVVIWGSAAEKPALPENLSVASYEVGVNGVSFFIVRAPAAGYTVAQRGYIADLRITEVLSRGLTGPVLIKWIRAKPTIYVGPVRIITVYPSDVAAWGVGSGAKLASMWARALRENLPKVVPGARKSALAVYQVAVNNCLLFRLRTAANYPSLKGRGAAVEQQVVEAMSRCARTVTCAPTANGVGVFADGILVVEATPDDARAAKLTTAALAEVWAANLRAALKRVSPCAPVAREAR